MVIKKLDAIRSTDALDTFLFASPIGYGSIIAPSSEIYGGCDGITLHSPNSDENMVIHSLLVIYVPRQVHIYTLL
eukprot:CAMPEP_0196173510 /NCGR_PEP_ID=MMETSP0911-20130528/6839_1 /TAXON_ID=49265 /ORGANISM="Thalassiosira rotula, Strain GSO102" /LENGTH=74 /DNA_ID=CAMNT_0041440729 /DNA_START=32 /DNA_END=256 /DNA_ORIENTATION=-